MDNIPHIIHYIWFGRSPKPEMVLECIASWKKYFPSWEIIEWNEDNYDVNIVPYTTEAYKLKKWAFVSDFARFDILNRYGGIYLDVDVEFIKPLPEYYLKLESFAGFECTGIVAPGLILATKPNNRIMQELLDIYSKEHFEIRKNQIYKTVNLHFTELLVRDGLIANNQLQEVDGFTIFPSEYFCGYDTDVMEPDITEKTICWHHYLSSWSNETIKTKFQKILKKIIGIKNYRRVLMFVRTVRRFR